MIRANTEGERSVVLVYSCRLYCTLYYSNLLKLKRQLAQNRKKVKCRNEKRRNKFPEVRLI